jgi:hypothetical protein
MRRTSNFKIVHCVVFELQRSVTKWYLDFIYMYKYKLNIRNIYAHFVELILFLENYVNNCKMYVIFSIKIWHDTIS